jgi:hypothetical protein
MKSKGCCALLQVLSQGRVRRLTAGPNLLRAVFKIMRSQNSARVLMLLIGLVMVMFILTACTAGANPLKNIRGADYNVAGFWRGLWHGLICIFTLIASLFSDSVTVYEVHNNGGWYNLGFVLGVALLFEGGGSVTVPSGSSD